MKIPYENKPLIEKNMDYILFSMVVFHFSIVSLDSAICCPSSRKFFFVEDFCGRPRKDTWIFASDPAWQIRDLPIVAGRGSATMGPFLHGGFFFDENFVMRLIYVPIDRHDACSS